MLAIGCTGGIGSGKSTVSALLVHRGADLIDADELSREVSMPTGAAYGAILERFGPNYLDAEGALDRTRLAARVFADSEALLDLEAIVHPIVEQAVRRRLEGLSASDTVVVVDVALLVEKEWQKRLHLDGVLVVDAPERLCVERLIKLRGYSEDDARKRIAVQASSDERLRAADFVIVNVGSLEELSDMVDEAWRWIERLRAEQGR